jgi:transposase
MYGPSPRARGRLALHGTQPAICSGACDSPNRRSLSLGRLSPASSSTGPTSASGSPCEPSLPRGAKGSVILPRRWKVERTIGWLMNARRNIRDYERLPQHSEAQLNWSLITRMARRLARKRRALPQSHQKVQ